MSTSEEWLSEIRERAGAATPGPWTWSPGMIEAPSGGDRLPNIIMDAGNIPGEYDDDDAAAALGAWGSNDDAKANLAFLAAAREDVPALLAEVDRLSALLVAEHLATEAAETENDRLRARLREIEYELGELLINDGSVDLTDGIGA